MSRNTTFKEYIVLIIKRNLFAENKTYHFHWNLFIKKICNESRPFPKAPYNTHTHTIQDNIEKSEFSSVNNGRLDNLNSIKDYII